MHKIETLLTMRKRMRDFGESLSTEQLLAIPPGFKNNIGWNLGHMVVTQQVLCYKLSGLEMPIDPKHVEFFGKGTSPKEWCEAPDMESLLPLITELAEGFAHDFKAGVFREFQPYETAVGITLADLEQAVAFNQMHEGIHLGYAMAQRRALGA